MEQTLIITPFYPPNKGGAESFAKDLAEALSKKYIVHIGTIKWKKPIIWQGLSWLSAVTMVSKLLIPTFKMTRKYQYKKVYALGIIPSFICAILGIKFYTVILALYDFKKRNIFTRFILNKAEKIFVEGERGKKDILNLGISEEKIVKFQHWCNQFKFTYIPKNNQRLKVLFIGRPIKIKGKHIIEQCEQLTIGIDYEYIENVNYDLLPDYYKNSSIVVVPSLYSEGFSRVVIEAASCGCVIIASNKGALPELVSPFGKIIEPTPENFSKELLKLKNDKCILEQMQLKTAIYAKEHFSEKNSDIFLGE